MKKKLIIIFSVLIYPSLIFSAPCGSQKGDCFALTNPLGDSGIHSITDLLVVILNGIVYISIPIIVLAFIYSGFKFVKSQGDSTGISDAKKTFLYTLGGAVIILSSNLILNVVATTTTELISS